MLSFNTLPDEIVDQILQFARPALPTIACVCVRLACLCKAAHLSPIITAASARWPLTLATMSHYFFKYVAKRSVIVDPFLYPLLFRIDVLNN